MRCTYPVRLLGFVMLLLITTSVQAVVLDTIQSNIVTNPNYRYNTLNEYKTYEGWGDWSMPIGDPKASSVLNPAGDITYGVKNIEDYDLNTAWVGKNGIGDCLEFTFNFPENTAYAGAYQFYGICNVFNGYCKSLKIWQENSRVKMLKVYYNNTPICYVLLKDTWQFQTFDIGKYFVNRRFKKYMNAPYEIKEGDVLKFEIVSVYKGSKYKDVAISEFLCEGAGN